MNRTAAVAGRGAVAHDARMLISVIVPARNAAGTLKECLSAVTAAAGDRVEIIVVDDASEDETAEIAARFDCAFARLRSASGPAAARNAGAVRASGDILLFIDADVLVRHTTIERICEHFRDPSGVAAVFGSYDDAPPARTFWSLYKNLFHHFIHQRGRPAARTFWAGCGAVRRDAFLAVAGFNEDFSTASIEDIELGYRLHAAGYTLRLDRTIQVTHLKRWTFLQVVRVDVSRRAVPWGRMLLRQRHMAADLNLRWEHRASVVLLYGALATIAIVAGTAPSSISGLQKALQLAGPVAIALTLALNLPLYRFFAGKLGLAFAVRVVPAHFLYYLYSGAGLLWAAVTLGAAPPLRGSLSAATPRPTEPRA